MICQELNLPFINTALSGAPQAQSFSSGPSQAQTNSPGASQAQVYASGVSQPQVPAAGFSQSQDGKKAEHVEAPGVQAKGTTGGNGLGTDVAHGATDASTRAQLAQDQSTLYHFREMQRRQVEFVKKRVLLLEKGLNAEWQKIYYVSILCSVIWNYY